MPVELHARNGQTQVQQTRKPLVCAFHHQRAHILLLCSSLAVCMTISSRISWPGQSRSPIVAPNRAVETLSTENDLHDMMAATNHHELMTHCFFNEYNSSLMDICIGQCDIKYHPFAPMQPQTASRSGRLTLSKSPSTSELETGSSRDYLSLE